MPKNGELKMIESVFFILVGCTIGWNFPQPTYAKLLQEWALSKWKEFKNK